MEFNPVVFTIGNQEYGVDIELVSGIEKIQQIVKVPNSNPDIKGIINLRGDVIPIYSLRHHFGLEETEVTDDTRFIVVNTNGLNIALEVEKVDEIQEVTEDMIHTLPRIVRSEKTRYIDKVVNENGRLILVLSIENLLTEEETKDIKKLVEDLKN